MVEKFITGFKICFCHKEICESDCHPQECFDYKNGCNCDKDVCFYSKNNLKIRREFEIFEKSLLEKKNKELEELDQKNLSQLSGFGKDRYLNFWKKHGWYSNSRNEVLEKKCWKNPEFYQQLLKNEEDKKVYELVKEYWSKSEFLSNQIKAKSSLKLKELNWN